MNGKVQLSLACLPGLNHMRALETAFKLQCESKLIEPAWGEIETQHIQLVPQSFGYLSEAIVQQLLVLANGKSRLRLHANVQVEPGGRCKADLSTFQENFKYFARLAEISKLINAPCYTAHAGRRVESTIQQLIENSQICSDLFGCPVGIEGQYPSKTDDWMISTWGEYRILMESGAYYVVDLSHLNILSVQSGGCDLGLVRAMLSNEKCLEVHVSSNDGIGDHHQICDKPTWWTDLLGSIHSSCTVFTEGNLLYRRKEILANI